MRGAPDPQILHTVSYLHLVPGLLSTYDMKTPSSSSTGYLLYCSALRGPYEACGELMCRGAC